MNFKLHTCN